MKAAFLAINGLMLECTAHSRFAHLTRVRQVEYFSPSGLDLSLQLTQSAVANGASCRAMQRTLPSSSRQNGGEIEMGGGRGEDSLPLFFFDSRRDKTRRSSF